MSKWILESIGGDLQFTTSEDGTRVTVEIPPGDRIEREDLNIPSIKEREQRWESIVERMTDAVLQVDSEWKITFLDERAEEILGVRAEALLGEDLWEQFGDAQGTPFEETYRTAMDTRSTERIMDYYQPIDAWLEVVVYPEFDGGLSFFFRDVTEDQSRREELENAQRRIEFALDVTDATVWEWDFVNDSIITHPETHSGIEIDVSTLADFLAGIHPDDQSRVQESLRKAIDSGDPYQIEYRVPTEDGIQWLTDHGEVRYQNGSPTEMIGTARDITDLKEREQKLRERVKELDAIHRTRAIFDQNDQPITELLAEFASVIPEAFQYPDKTAVRIDYDGGQFSTTEFESGSSPITTRIQVTEDVPLEVEVARLDTPDGERDGAFLSEERKLLETLVSIVRAELIERVHRDRLERLQDLLITAEEIGEVGLWEINVETADYLWTDGTRRLHGVGDDFEPTLENAIEFYHPDDREMVSETVERALETGEDFDLVARLRTANDEVRWVRAGGRVLDNGTALRGYIQDITEHRALQEEIEASEERLRVALNAGELGMWELDLQSEASPVRSFRHDEIFGYEEPVEEWSFERFLEHVHPEDRELVERSFEDAFEDGSWRFSCRIERIDGAERWISAHGLFFYDDANKPDHAIGIVEDVTAEKDAERELKEKTERLEEFARMVSHDIKNPLSVATGRLELYRERAEEGDLEAVEHALTRIEGITTDLTALARFGTPAIDSEPVSLEETARAAWEMIETRDASLEVEDNEIVADRSQLQGIFENLFKNAVGHGGSEVTVRVGSLTDGFYIEDTGAGISPDIRDQIFQSGFSTGYSGSGIGLTIVSRIVDVHGWSIALTDSAEGGARFEITRVDFV